MEICICKNHYYLLKTAKCQYTDATCTAELGVNIYRCDDFIELLTFDLYLVQAPQFLKLCIDLSSVVTKLPLPILVANGISHATQHHCTHIPVSGGTHPACVCVGK